MKLKEAMIKAKATGRTQKVTEREPQQEGDKRYSVKWNERRVTNRVIATFVNANSKEDALDKVKNRKNHNVAMDVEISQYEATYKGKAK